MAIPEKNPKLEYSLKARVSESELNAFVSQIWRDAVLKDPALLSEIESAAGKVSPKELASGPYKVQITVGAQPGSVTLVVALAVAGISISSRVLLDTWSKVILPSIEKKFGSE